MSTLSRHQLAHEARTQPAIFAWDFSAALATANRPCAGRVQAALLPNEHLDLLVFGDRLKGLSRLAYLTQSHEITPNLTSAIPCCGSHEDRLFGEAPRAGQIALKDLVHGLLRVTGEPASGVPSVGRRSNQRTLPECTAR